MQKHTKWIILSIVFLAAAFVLPTYVFYSALGTTVQQAVDTIPDYYINSPQTGPRAIDEFVQAQETAQMQLLVMVIGLETVLVSCFGITLWYGIRCRDLCRNYPAP
jgi:hypothetical protein